MSLVKYKTILLDADGTLLDFSRSEREALSDALRAIGVTPNEEMIGAYSRINESLWKRLERGEIEKRVLFYHRFELLFEQFGIDADAKQTADRYMQSLSHKGYSLEGAKRFCERLSKLARLYIVTNGTEFIQRGRWAQSGLFPYFEEIFISDVIGYEKPRIEFFSYVAEHVPNFDRRSTLLVGDSLTSDIQGGLNAGIDTCWYNPNRKEAPEDIRQRLVLEAHDFDGLYQWIAEETR